MGGSMPDAGVLATILLIVGLFLLALELMIPSFGMIGILSAITLLVSAWCAWQAWWGTSPGFFWTYFAFWLLGIPSVLGGMLFLLQNTTLGDHIVLRGPDVAPVGTTGPEGNPLADLVGKTGTASSLLTPGGMVTINNERFHAESPGMVIENGTPIEVVNVRGTRLVVRSYDGVLHQAKENSPSADSLAETVVSTDSNSTGHANSDHASPETGILDFEIPEG